MNENPHIWNPYAKGYFQNPHAHLRFLRAQAPVHKGINGCWMLLKHEDVKFFLTDPRFKTWKTHEAVAATDRHLGESESFDELSTVFNKVLLFHDPPEHARLRSVIAKVWNSFSLQEHIETAISEALEALSGESRADLAAGYARRVPALVIMKILGLPAGDYAKVTNWSYQFIAALEPFVSLYRLRKYNREAREFHQYLTGIIQLKARRPDEFFIGKFLSVNETLDEPLTRDEIISILCMLFFAGIETSVNLLGQSILLLLENPGQADLVRGGGGAEQLSAPAANELVRYVSPVNYTKRVAGEDVEIRGQAIKAGDALLGAFISANFDEDVFENPERLDLTRVLNPHLGFGHGAHFCLGARLGREQISRSLPALFRRYPNIALQSEKIPQWDKLVMNRALVSLPVDLKG